MLSRYVYRLPALSISLFALLLMTNLVQAEEPLDPRITPEVLKAFEANEFEHDGLTLPYRLLSPLAQEEGKEYPLVLFLHGLGERGSENQRQLIHGGRAMAGQALRERHPAFIVAPQCPSGVTGVGPDGKEIPRVWTRSLSRMSPQNLDLAESASPQMAAAQALVAELIQTLPVDPQRVYITGLSMGGYATWEIITRNPDVYAAAAPVCGGGDPKHASRLTDLPLWAFHGSKDLTIPRERSIEMIEAISNAGGRPIYTEFPGVGHASWTPTYASQQFWDWMFAQRKSTQHKSTD